MKGEKYAKIAIRVETRELVEKIKTGLITVQIIEKGKIEKSPTITDIIHDALVYYYNNVVKPKVEEAFKKLKEGES